MRYGNNSEDKKHCSRGVLKTGLEKKEGVEAQSQRRRGAVNEKRQGNQIGGKTTDFFTMHRG